jgi:hypothetical protein
MGKVEAAVNPDALLVYFNGLLGRNGPLPLGGDPLALGKAVSGQAVRGRRAASHCAEADVYGTFALCLRSMAIV